MVEAITWANDGLAYWCIYAPLGLDEVPSGTKPLPEPMFTQIYVAKWRH